MTDYDGYTLYNPSFGFNSFSTAEIDEATSTSITQLTPSLYTTAEIDEATATTISQLTPSLFTTAEIDEATATVVSQLTPSLFTSQDLDELASTSFVKTYKQVIKKPQYQLRACDSGLTAPGYVYWSSYSFDYTDAPTPIGSYTILSIVDIKMVTTLV